MTDVTHYRGCVPTDATRTRERLLHEGARLFAERGIHGAQMRDVVRAAGQANDSAVHYHFGSREGLLTAICTRNLDAMEPERRERLARQDAAPDLATVLTDLIAPTSARLDSQDGRYFLRITAQLAGQAGVRTGSTPPPVVGEALRTQLGQLQEICARSVPAALAGERIAVVIGALTSALADRAVAIDEGPTPHLDPEAFLSNLVTMLSAALLATAPASNSSR
jgi:AcrR family transcriptional regulator